MLACFRARRRALRAQYVRLRRRYAEVSGKMDDAPRVATSRKMSLCAARLRVYAGIAPRDPGPLGNVDDPTRAREVLERNRDAVRKMAYACRRYETITAEYSAELDEIENALKTLNDATEG